MAAPELLRLEARLRELGSVLVAFSGGADSAFLLAAAGRVLGLDAVVAATADMPGDKVHNCVLENARRVARQVRQSEPVLKEAGERKGLKVLAADYALDTGAVTLLDSR